MPLKIIKMAYYVDTSRIIAAEQAECTVLFPPVIYLYTSISKHEHIATISLNLKKFATIPFFNLSQLYGKLQHPSFFKFEKYNLLTFLMEIHW